MTSINEVYAIVKNILTNHNYECSGIKHYQSIIRNNEFKITTYKYIDIDFSMNTLNIFGYIRGYNAEENTTIFNDNKPEVSCAKIIDPASYRCGDRELLYKFDDLEGTLIDYINQLETDAFEASGNRFPELFSNTSCEPVFLK
jgi:hypothetical protein